MSHKRLFLSKSVLACLVALLILATAPVGAGAVTWITSHLIGGSQVEELHGAAGVPGGGYVAVGSTMSTDGDMTAPGFTLMDGVIVRISPTGVVLWTTKAGGNANDNFNSVARTADDGYVAVGYSYSTTGDMAGLSKGIQDGMITKFDADGNKLFTRSLGGNGYDWIESVTATADGGFVVVGNTTSTNIGYGQTALGIQDALIAKYDAAGNPVWVRQLGGTYADYFTDVVEAEGGVLIAVGESESDDGLFAGRLHDTYDGVIVRLTAAGDPVWADMVGGAALDTIKGITLVDGGFVVAGSTRSTDGDFAMMPVVERQAFLAKYSLDDTQLWITVSGGSTEDAFEDVVRAGDGSLIAFGYSNSVDGTPLAHPGYALEAWMAEFSSAGLLAHSYSFGGPGDELLEAGVWTSATQYAGFGVSWSTELQGEVNHGLGDGLALLVDIDSEPVDDIDPDLTLTPDTTATTEGNVVVTAAANDAGGIKQITLPDATVVPGTLTSLTATFTATDNGTYSFVAEDLAGNTKTQTITIANIDRTPRILTITPANTGLVTGVTQLTVNLTTRYAAPGATVRLRLLDNGKLPLSPAVEGTGTVGADGSAVVVLTLPADLVPGTYYFSANVDGVERIHDTTSITVSTATPIPDTGATAVVPATAAGALLLGATCTLAAGKRRRSARQR
ncbi:MAG: hypothetical protein KBA30_01880 [Clostridia bacterium]|nr:hypothetical protein [Clostridia bacterium]